jgi:ATP-dependent Clp protease protease subunit
MSEKFKTLLIILAPVLAVIAVVFTIIQVQKNQIANIMNNYEYFLESFYREGLVKSKIDYADPVLNQRNVFITTDLDEKQAQTAMKELLYLDKKDPGVAIDLYLDTTGGTGGEMLSTFIHTLESPVNVYALDYCASAGAMVLASATGRRYAFSTSRIIVHILQAEVLDLDDETYNSTNQKNKVTDIFWTTFSKLPEEIYGIGEERYYNFTAEEALEYGLVDEIVTMED